MKVFLRSTWTGHIKIIAENSSTTIGRGSREGIMLGMEQTRGAELEGWNQRVVVWPPLLSHQPEDVMI